MISIILTAYKEPDTIGKAIEQILKNKLKNYELLVTAPDDETLNAAKKYSSKIKKLRLIRDEGKGKPNALNNVLPQAKGDIIVLTDGDIYIRENSINELLKHFSDSKVGAVSGHPVSKDSRKTLMGYWGTVLLDIAHKIRKQKDQENQFLFCTGYLFAMKKGLVEKMPLEILDDSYISQEIWRKGYKIKYEEKAVVFIKNPETFKDWIKQKKRNTFGEFQLKKYKVKSMRGFKDEARGGIFKVFTYPKTMKEISWTVLLVFARLYAWINATYNYKIKKASMQKVWVRIETTK
ncbi:hypothetical protein CMI37_26965 [Candidatus Pacearchaeota archaeon]|nr:hypothetical protein [Candidatus Pacearchaeota archaeon]|tara:strand:+ start:27220 stop:28095 length:876 start_codon:yes stop_codon:yes gene_type:complete